MSTSRDPYEPWLQKSSGWSCKKVNGKLQYLAKDYIAAKHKLSQMVHAAQTNSLTRDWLQASSASRKSRSAGIFRRHNRLIRDKATHRTFGYTSDVTYRLAV